MNCKLIVALAIASTSTLLGQSSTTNRETYGYTTGLGRITFSIDDLPAATSDPSQLGVAYLNGEYYISHADPGTSRNISVFDANGTFLRTIGQPSIVATTFGLLDGTTDGTSVMFGWEGGIVVLDPNGNQINTIEAANGTQNITQPILSQGGRPVHMALGFDPNGNNGTGSFFVGNFGLSIQEIALDGTLLNEFPNLAAPDEWIAFGIEVAPDGQTLWINTSGDLGFIREYSIDRSTQILLPTGRQFSRSELGSGFPQGGLAIVPGGADFRGCGYDVVGVNQLADMTAYRVDQWDGYPSTSEPVLLTGVDNDTLDDEIAAVDTSTNVTFGFESTAAGIFFINLATPSPGLPGPRFGFPSLTEFVLDLPRGLSFNFPIPANTQIDFPVASAPTIPGSLLLNCQLISIDSGIPVGSCGLALPFAVSRLNGFRLFDGIAPTYTVTASGANSFNSDTTSGFWQIQNVSGADIVRVELDFGQSADRTLVQSFFDTTQVGLADRFDGGNSTALGCTGTYRNGSDVTTGLVFDASNSPSACDLAANTGFIAANLSTRLIFRFTDFGPGETFEFDCDTDIAVVSGDQMAGLNVTIEDVSGAIFRGTLRVDPSQPNTSSVSF